MLHIKYKPSLVLLSVFASFIFLGSIAPAVTAYASPVNTLRLVAADTGEVKQPDAQHVRNDCNGSDLKAGAAEGSDQHCGILDYLVIFINVLSAVVGIVIVTMITVGGIQYSTARDNPQAVQAAKSRITNALIALVSYLFMYALLNYLVPGGVL